MYIIYLDTVYDGADAGVLFRGPHMEARAVYNAFKKYNDAKNIVMKELEQNLYGLSKKQAESVVEELIDIIVDCQDKSSIWDSIAEGRTGYYDYSVDEVMREAFDLRDLFSSPCRQYIDVYRGNLVAERELLNVKA